MVEYEISFQADQLTGKRSIRLANLDNVLQDAVTPYWSKGSSTERRNETPMKGALDEQQQETEKCVNE